MLEYAIYPGSFDPITNGHVNIIKRISKLTDYIFIAILSNIKKTHYFTNSERISMVYNACNTIPNVIIVSFQNKLLVNFCNTHNIKCIFRGIRNIYDIEHEIDMAYANYQLGKIDTIWLPSYCIDISSSRVKEILFLEGNIAHFVPKNIIDQIQLYHKNKQII